MKKTLALVVLSGLLAGCSGGHPLAGGSWQQRLADGSAGMELEFDADSDGLIVHMPDNPDGGHEHAEKATYVLLEQAAEGVGVSVRWTLHGHVHEMKGSVKGDKLQLNSEDGVLEFERGHSAAH